LITHIHNLRSRAEVGLAPRDIPVTVEGSPAEESLSRQDKILKECEEYLRDSHRLHDLEKLKVMGKTRTAQINPLATTKHSLRITK
jgi:hypothetical protein